MSMNSDTFDLPNLLLNDVSGKTEGYADKLIRQVSTWLANTNFNKFRNEIEKSVIGQERLTVLLVNIYQYLRGLGTDTPSRTNSNVILVGPSGCGKTETYRTLKAYFSAAIPSFIVSFRDMSLLTSEGYRGHDTDWLVSDLKPTRGYGIVFLDEFDKRIVPDHNAYGDNVNQAIQNQLLATVEGSLINGIDTSRSLFIGMGSFDEIRINKKKEVRIGFGVDRNPIMHNSEITRQDMIEFGAVYELIGRFPSIINFGELSYAAVDQIINARLEEISKELKFPVTVSQEMRDFLHKNSNTEYGNRLIASFIRESVNCALVEILTNNILVSKLIITDAHSYQIKKSVNAVRENLHHK